MPSDFATSPAAAVQTPRGFDGGFVRARVEQPNAAIAERQKKISDPILVSPTTSGPP